MLTVKCEGLSKVKNVTIQNADQIICLEDRAQDVIDQNPYLTRRKLRCEAKEGHVVLKGTVRSYFQKQMAQESLRKLDGLVSIDNCLVVENN